MDTTAATYDTNYEGLEWALEWKLFHTLVFSYSYVVFDFCI